MSKTSAKNRYTQLMEWIESMNIKRKKRKNKRDSRLGYYEMKRNR